MRIAGIDLGAREVRLARAERHLGRVTVTGLARVPAADGAARAAVLADVAAWRPQVVHVALPAAFVTHRFLTLPFRDRRRRYRWRRSRSGT
jgi:RNase H-fold protein (predicted Holliday junction resolvase)